MPQLDNTATVQDTENPAIVCPAPVAVDATGPGGAAVSACSELQAFINLIDAQAGKAMGAGDAASLIEDVTRIRTVIGC